MNKLIPESKNVYYLSEGIINLDNNLIKELINIAKNNQLNIIRCCLHDGTSSKLMSMLLVILNKYIYPAHRHSWKDETYTCIRGKARYEEYDSNSKRLLVIDLNQGETIINKNKNFHLITPISNVLVLLESTVGPFTGKPLEFLDEQ